MHNHWEFQHIRPDTLLSYPLYTSKEQGFSSTEEIIIHQGTHTYMTSNRPLCMSCFRWNFWNISLNSGRTTSMCLHKTKEPISVRGLRNLLLVHANSSPMRALENWKNSRPDHKHRDFKSGPIFLLYFVVHPTIYLNFVTFYGNCKIKGYRNKVISISYSPTF